VATLRDIKRRINAVDNIEQITRAMYMVATAKLRQAEERVEQARPYAAELSGMLARLAGEHEHGGNHPLLEDREVKRVTHVIVTADRGLCGSYNANVIREAETMLRKEDRSFELIMVGKKGRDYFRRLGFDITRDYVDLGEEVSYERARELTEFLVSRFLDGETDEVNMLFTQFRSALSQTVTTTRLLPIVAEFREDDADEPARGERPDHFFEPSPERLFAELLPKYTQNQVFQTLMESKASEHGARMTAMKNATDNAEELIETLTLDFNRARQAAITREISEIVGGAEAIQQT